MTHDRNNKLRAVFLAAIMFMWLFAGTVAFAGSAGAQFNADDPDQEGDAPWDSGGAAWQGQQVWFEASDEGVYELREYDDDVGAFVDEFDLDAGDNVTIDTTDLDGLYVLVNPDGEVVGTTEGVEDDGVDGEPVEIRVQSLTTSFTQSIVEQDSNATVAISSNRATSFDLEVSSDNLSQAELQTAFQYVEADDVVDEGDDAVVLEGVSRDVDLTVHFAAADVEDGEEITFDFDVADTTAADSASITVGEDIEDAAQFGQAQYTQERGDIVTFDLEVDGVDSVNVTFGDEDQIGYEAEIEVTPNDEGEIVVEMNTWLASRVAHNPEEANSTVFTAVEGDIVSVNQSADDRERVLDAGLYDLVAQETTDAEQPIEFDVAVVNLDEPSLDQMVVHTYPDGATIDDPASLYAGVDAGTVTEADQIATQDGLVLAVEVSGVHGALAADDLENVTLTLEQTNPGPNEDPNVVEGAEFTTAFNDAENNSWFAVATTDELDGTAVGQEYNATFELTPDFLDQFLRQRNQPADSQSVTDEFEIVDREAEFDTEDVDGEQYIVVPAEEGAEISGTTSVAPGTDLRVRTRATGEAPFLRTQTATVGEDGAFSAEFDFSGVSEGQEFTASITRQGFENDAATPGVVGEIEEETPTPTPTPEEDDDDPTPTPEEDDDDPTPTPEEEDDDPPEDDTDDQAGFGAVVALIALLAAALIAARRHSFDN